MFGQRRNKWGYINSSLKAFDCIFHNLLIAKLSAYGFDYQPPRIMESFLSDRLQRRKVNNSFSRFPEIIFGFPQGSISDPLLFNTYIYDIFFDIIECGIASYAADNTSYNFDFSLDMEVVKSLLCLHDLDNVISNVEKIY